MRLRSFLTLTAEASLLTIIVWGMLSVGEAEVRTSTNYQLESDSINFGGGLSSSTSYQLESTGGEVATGRSESSSYSLRAGYQQMQEVFISISTPDTVVLLPDIGGITGGNATGSTEVLVVTDSPSGYQLTIVAENAPAMQKGGDTIADYVPDVSPDSDLSFITSASDVHFGFSPQGSDVVLRYRNNGLVCGAGSFSTAMTCWDGASTTPLLIASGAANQPNGATTTLYFQVGIGGGVAVPPGEYVATTTLTALPL